MDAWFSTWSSQCFFFPRNATKRFPRCAILLAEYLGYAGWTGGYEDRNWWQLHPPAAVVPARPDMESEDLDLGGQNKIGKQGSPLR